MLFLKLKRSLNTLLIPFLLVVSCNQNPIKNPNQVVVEEGTDTTLMHKAASTEDAIPSSQSEAGQQNPVLGYWVGYFEVDRDRVEYGDTYVYVDEGFMWNRNNKINISIDEIQDGQVKGHSVVAGNDRPFEGTVSQSINPHTNEVSYKFEVREPGDDRYDGSFSFEIVDNKLTGTWEAYKKLQIKYRKYSLEHKSFQYNPDIGLEANQRYIDWKEFTETKESFEEEEGEEVYEWISREFASATSKIYELNASSTLLTKDDVSNLMKGDLKIIRNTIYARHGYSFRNRPLRVFFDAQSWYIPVHADIKKDFTEIELKNIDLLLRFEGNAEEYYDRFGRG